MRRIFIAIALVCFVAATAAAQTKVSATAQCGQPDSQHELPVGDVPDHSLNLQQLKCTYTKPMEIAGAKSVTALLTITNEVSGDTIRARGCQVATMDSGDKVFISHEGTGTPEERAPTTAPHPAATSQANTNSQNRKTQQTHETRGEVARRLRRFGFQFDSAQNPAQKGGFLNWVGPQAQTSTFAGSFSWTAFLPRATSSSSPPGAAISTMSAPTFLARLAKSS